MTDNYAPPQVKVTRVMLEKGIVTCQVSVKAYLDPDWKEIETPVGTYTNEEGGDIYLF